jgi:hypothetical protein
MDVKRAIGANGRSLMHSNVILDGIGGGVYGTLAGLLLALPGTSVIASIGRQMGIWPSGGNDLGAFLLSCVGVVSTGFVLGAIVGTLRSLHKRTRSSEPK